MHVGWCSDDVDFGCLKQGRGFRRLQQVSVFLGADEDWVTIKRIRYKDEL